MICINTQTYLSEYHKIRLNEIKNWFIKHYKLPDVSVDYSEGYSEYLTNIVLSIKNFDELTDHPLYKYGTNLLNAYTLMLLHELAHHLQRHRYKRRYLMDGRKQYFTKTNKEYYNLRCERHANLLAIKLFKYLKFNPLTNV